MEWLREAIMDYWNKFVDFIFRQIEGAYDLLEWVVVSVLNFFWSIFEYVWDFFVYLYDLFLGEEGFIWRVVGFFVWLFSLLLEQIEWALDMLPDIGAILMEYREAFDFGMFVIGKLNLFAPVVESLHLLSIYLFIALIVIIIRWIITFIPGTAN